MEFNMGGMLGGKDIPGENEDKMSTFGVYFEVKPSSGAIDFGISTTLKSQYCRVKTSFLLGNATLFLCRL